MRAGGDGDFRRKGKNVTVYERERGSNMDATTAKQFFISKVIDEAKFERVKLSEVERKMLYFTETSPSIPDLYEVNAEFERDYDADEYEDKVTALLKNARERDRQTSPTLEKDWNDALEILKKEDHYILVMLYSAFSEYRDSLLPTHRVRDYVIYIAVGISLVLACIGIALWRH